MGNHLRSVLFAPANHPVHAGRSLLSQAHAAVLDLEDAVAPAEKPAARDRIAALLSGPRRPGIAAIVRINGLDTEYALDDLTACVGPGLDAVMLPKCDSGEQVATVSWVLDQLERRHGLPASSLELLPLIETAAGPRAIGAIAAASPRVRRVAFGALDFSLDTGMRYTPDHEGIRWARIQTVVESRSAGLEAPIDTVFPNLGDSDGFAAEAAEGRRLGFQGKLCIHPTQVEIANREYAASAADLEQARSVVDAFAEATAAGLASIRLGDQFIDAPVAERARRLLEEAAAG
ncbi:MAG: CoA ester lyase [Candidatus Dormibacteraceae bacterium]